MTAQNCGRTGRTRRSAPTLTEYPPKQIRLQQPVRIASLFQFLELRNRLLAIKRARGFGGGFAVLGEVETSARGQDNAVKFLCQLIQTGAVRVGDLEIHRERETVHGVGEEELVGAVTFGDAEVGGESTLLGESQDLGPGMKRSFLRKETLVLDESAAAVGEFPVRHVVQQKVERGVALSKNVAAQARDVLGSVHAPRAKVVHEGRHEKMQQALGHHAKHAAGQRLIIELHGLLRVGVFALVQIIRGVDLSVADGDAIQPADDVIVFRRAIFEALQLLGQRARRPGVDFEQAGVNPLHLQANRSKHAQHPVAADHGVKQVGVFLWRAGDFRACGQHRRERGDVLANRPHPKIIFTVDVRAETTAQRGGPRPRDDGRPPTVGQDALPKLTERHPRLASHLTCGGVPFEDLVHR